MKVVKSLDLDIVVYKMKCCWGLAIGHEQLGLAKRVARL